ncbi:FAD-dependent oxidoreductase [Nocardioides sambongensis]|uniref:FAD-dependent oxidoreductase n=1 Tax=Nocardioides sambongensis TaxID=2589074 RepID=UPI0018C8B1AD|nr:GMC family oxidoreductase [Nocardioides sambongensis]
MDADWVVIGSGFGGSASALRLAEKGYDVVVLEQGRRFADDDFAGRMSHAPSMIWRPELGLRGIMQLIPFKHMMVAAGAGVGGGSLVYANTMYQPHDDDFYRHPQWAELADWRSALEPHYAEAKRMMGVVDYVGDGPSPAMLRDVADEFDLHKKARSTPVAVYFGEPGVTAPDPYFGGDGPARTGCIRCGECMLGCRYNAKNTLTKNYLHLAERAGVRIQPDSKVTDIRPLGAADGRDGYELQIRRPGLGRSNRRTLRARGIIVAAGPYGTNELLAQCRDRGSLPRISDRLGTLVRTNSEAIVAATADDPGADYRDDIAITTSIYPDEKTHATNNTYGDGGDLMALMFAPFTSGEDPHRGRTTLKLMLAEPRKWLSLRRIRGWSRRTVLFTVMQSTDQSMRFTLRRGLSRWGGVLQSAPGAEPPSTHLPIANAVAESAARRMDGYPQSSLYEALMGAPVTAHLLGGAPIGASAETGVVDADQRVFGYRNMLVCDGSAVPANPGVNPSLTILAMTEHAMSRLPEKQTSDFAASAGA